MLPLKDTRHITALVLYKKDLSRSHRRVLLSSQELPFIYASAFGAAHSLRLSSLTSPFALVQFKVAQNQYGWQIQDAHGLEFYTRMNEDLDYFHMVNAWVKILIDTSGAGEDPRLFSLLYPLIQNTSYCPDWITLDALFYLRFLWIQGQLPSNLEGLHVADLLQDKMEEIIKQDLNWGKIRSKLRSYLNQS